jgi:hypothetical protein
VHADVGADNHEDNAGVHTDIGAAENSTEVEGGTGVPVDVGVVEDDIGTVEDSTDVKVSVDDDDLGLEFDGRYGPQTDRCALADDQTTPSRILNSPSKTSRRYWPAHR